MFTPARDRNAPFDVDDVAGLVGRLRVHAPVPIERGVVVVVPRRRRAADAEHVAARAPHDKIDSPSGTGRAPGVRAVVAARGAPFALAVHAARGHAVRIVFRDRVRPAVRLKGLGLARLRLGHVAMAVGACVLNFVSRAALDVVATAVLFFSREPEARGTRGQQIGLTRCAAALRRN